MTIGVILSLVGALTFFASGGRFLAETPSTSTPLAQVASTGDPGGLIETSGAREVPEPIEPAHDATTHPAAARRELISERRSEAIQKLEQELLALRGQIGDLSRSHLESQLTEIRHAEQLLVQHQTSREIATLEREIATLKGQVTSPLQKMLQQPITAKTNDEEDLESEVPETRAVNVRPLQRANQPAGETSTLHAPQPIPAPHFPVVENSAEDDAEPRETDLAMSRKERKKVRR